MRTPRNKRRRGWTLIELLVAATCLLTVLALTAPAVQSARSSARQSQCRNNLKQIGLAMHNYHETFGTFPPGWISGDASPDSGPRFGWQSFLLPYVEEMAIYRRMDFHHPVPAAGGVFVRDIAVYRCPADATPATNPLRGGYGTSNYSGNYGFSSERGDRTGKSNLTPWIAPRRMQFWPGQLPPAQHPNGLFWRNSSVRFRDITDGSSNTLAAGERAATSGAGIWVGVGSNALFNDAVTDCGSGNEINARFTSFSSFHGHGANFVIGDGSVRFISENIAPATFRAIASRSDGEIIEDF